MVDRALRNCSWGVAYHEVRQGIRAHAEQEQAMSYRYTCKYNLAHMYAPSRLSGVLYQTGGGFTMFGSGRNHST